MPTTIGNPETYAISRPLPPPISSTGATPTGWFFRKALPASIFTRMQYCPTSGRRTYCLGFPTRMYPETLQVEPILMSSRDGVTFNRWDEAIIPITAPEDRDGIRSNYMAWGLVQLPHSDRELSVYATEAYWEGPDSRIRRFTYRVDGFVSVNSTGGAGQLLTKPLIFEGDTMHVNFATFDQGTLRAELQDMGGNPIPGYTLNDFQPLSGDEIDQVMTWNGSADVGQFARTPVRILYELENADLYSFQFTGPPQPTIGRTLFKDNFEDAPAVASGVFPDSASGDCDPVAQVGTWDIVGASGGAEVPEYLAQVTNYGTPGAQEGNNYLRTGWINQTNAQAYANGYLAGGATTDDVTASVWFYANTDRTNDGRMFLFDDQDVYLSFVRMGENNIAGGQTGQIAWSDNGTWVNSSIDGGNAADAWHHLEVSTDWINGEYTVTLDGELLGTSAFSNPAAANVNRINLNGWTSGDPPAMFDDLMVYVKGTALGDANCDGRVDAADAAILAANWQKDAGAIWAEEDFNGDGAVNDVDATLLAANWQNGVGINAQATVPEPGMLALLASMATLLFCRRKR